MDELEKIDTIRRRMSVSYREAKEALDQSGGEVAAALVYLEDKGSRWKERIQVAGSDLVGKVRDLIHQGNVSRIRVRQGDRTLIEFPVTVGVVGALLLPTLAAVGVIAALVTNCTIEVEREVPARPAGPEGAGDAGPGEPGGGEESSSKAPQG